jgi:hypothetical protein
MAKLLGDTAQHYATLDIVYKWDVRAGAIIDTTIKRAHHTQSLRLSATHYVIKKSLGTPATLIVGAAVYLSTLGDTQIFRLLDTGAHADGDESCQVCVNFTAAGEIEVRRSSRTGTLLGTTSGQGLAVDTWYYVEFKAKIDNSVGTYDVHVDGSSVLSDTGVDTQDSGNAYADAVGLGESKVSHAYYADIYMLDTTGGVDDDILGPIKGEVILPTGAGNYTQWTPSAGSNWQNVDDDAAIDDDTTYNHETVAVQKDSFAYANVALTGTILGVTQNLCVRMDDAGPHTIRPLVRISSTDYFGSTVSVTGAYLVRQYNWAVSPATAVAWTDAEINGAEFGYELVS